MSFLPIVLPHNAPAAPGTLAELDYARLLPCTESIYVSTQSYEKGPKGAKRYAEYLTFWYVGQIPEDAVRLFPFQAEGTESDRLVRRRRTNEHAARGRSSSPARAWRTK